MVDVDALVSRGVDGLEVPNGHAIHPLLQPLFPGGLMPAVYRLDGASSVGLGLLTHGWCGVVGLPELSVEAARRDIDVAEASRLPRLSAFAQGNYNNYFGTLGSATAGAQFSQSETTANVGLRATVPIYQGGAPSARVRQSQARFGQAQETVVETERQVVATVRSAFARYQAALDVIDSSARAVEANELALEGTRAENSVGLRTILDILNAEQELLNSQVDLVSARRNAYVAGFNLLAAMGEAEAEDLGLDGGILYRSEDNYRRVRNIWFDWDDDPMPVTQSTRTVDNPERPVVTIGEN